ncbi:MAG: ribbon-helix-helix protein, CopG family [Candidatus Hodarchaeales archaeon]|jgi:3-methyladenine DNA glycosylase AlkD
MTTSERISLRIEKKKKEKLEELAKKLDTTSSELVRELIENLIRFSSLYDSLTLETIFSTNPLLTIGDFLQLPNQREKVWNQWFKEEVDSTITEVGERDVKKG